MPPFVRSLAFAITLSSILVGATHAECLQGCLSCGACSSRLFDDCNRADGSGYASRDLVRSSTYAAATCGIFRAEEWASAADRFTVGGLPEGAPVIFTAAVRLRGFGYGRLTLNAFIREGQSNSITYDETFTIDPIVGAVNVDTTLAVTVSTFAGTEFTIEHAVFVDAVPRFVGSVATLETGLSFSGLPPGSRVTSCNGYLQDSPAPARPASWGAIKTRYR